MPCWLHAPQFCLLTTSENHSFLLFLSFFSFFFLALILSLSLFIFFSSFIFLFLLVFYFVLSHTQLCSGLTPTLCARASLLVRLRGPYGVTWDRTPVGYMQGKLCINHTISLAPFFVFFFAKPGGVQGKPGSTTCKPYPLYYLSSSYTRLVLKATSLCFCWGQ